MFDIIIVIASGCFAAAVFWIFVRLGRLERHITQDWNKHVRQRERDNQKIRPSDIPDRPPTCAPRPSFRPAAPPGPDPFGYRCRGCDTMQDKRAVHTCPGKAPKNCEHCGEQIIILHTCKCGEEPTDPPKPLGGWPKGNDQCGDPYP